MACTVIMLRSKGWRPRNLKRAIAYAQADPTTMQMIVVDSPTITEFAMGFRNVGSDNSRVYEPSVSCDGERSGVLDCSAVEG